MVRRLPSQGGSTDSEDYHNLWSRFEAELYSARDTQRNYEMHPEFSNLQLLSHYEDGSSLSLGMDFRHCAE